MSRDERREQIVAAAMAVFAESGYAGATTDQIARAAGVSQPYVVRIFGSKEDLFSEVLDRVTTEIIGGFRSVAPGPDAKDEMAAAYSRFVADPDKLRVLLHAFALGSDPVLGARAREVLGIVFDLYRQRTGGSAQEARRFVADGMLVSILFAVRAPEHTEDERISALVECYPVVAETVDDDPGRDLNGAPQREGAEGSSR